MLSKEDNELLTHVGPGTPMGTLMRQYWLPAMRSDELAAPDCPPLRLRLLGENLIAFRTTSGKVGLVQDACPHRGASLFFGRNEEEGLRCVYHGWKFDVSGACVDMPSEPAESNFKNKVRTRAYAVEERGGVIWAYMGPRESPPPLPHLEVNMLDRDVKPQMCLMECNWLQTLEGDMDTAHLGFLHLGSGKPEDFIPGSYDYYMVTDRAPRYAVIDTEIGTSYGAYRPAEEDTTYWRIAHFLFPFYALIPTGNLGTVVRAQAWVPLDDHNTMYWGWQVAGTVAGRDGSAQAAGNNAATGRPLTAAAPSGRNAGFEYLPDSSDWLGRYRLNQNRHNDYGIDREAQQRGDTFTGIRGIRQQDKAVAESMGQIMDRTHEHLGTSDTMIIQTRRRLLRAVKALIHEGTVPPGVENPDAYRVRSGSIILPRGEDWLETTRHLRKPNVPIGAPAVEAKP